MRFDELGLSAEIQRAVSEQGYREATLIQQRSIPVVLDGKDVLGGAQTGTGKTASFVLPVLQRLQSSHPRGRRNRPRALMLAPTRELAAQVCDSVRIYSRYLSISTTAIFGGVSIRPQIAKIRQGTDVVVATPGRLLDHLNQGTIDLRGIEILVLDEADRMLDMGFIRDIRKLLQALPANRQNLLFSATFSTEIRKLASEILDCPTEIHVSPRNTTVDRIDQVIYPVDSKLKRPLLTHLIRNGNWRQVLVFTRTKHGANRLAKQLTQDRLEVTTIHGNKSQGARTKALADFKTGRVRVLVATDIAARGLDIHNLPYVVNFDLPHAPKDYLHRIGRTARAGLTGQAVSLVTGEDQEHLKNIEIFLKTRLRREIIVGFEPSTTNDAGTKQRRHIEKRAKPSRNSRKRSKKQNRSARATGDGGKSRRSSSLERRAS